MSDLENFQNTVKSLVKASPVLSPSTLSVPLQLFQLHKCFIDVFENNSAFIVMHNKYIVNVTANVMVC